MKLALALALAVATLTLPAHAETDQTDLAQDAYQVNCHTDQQRIEKMCWGRKGQVFTVPADENNGTELFCCRYE